MQPQAFVQGSAQQFNLLIEPCFACKQPSVIALLSQTLKTIFKLFPLDQADNPAQVMCYWLLACDHGTSISRSCQLRAASNCIYLQVRTDRNIGTMSAVAGCVTLVSCGRS